MGLTPQMFVNFLNTNQQIKFYNYEFYLRITSFT
jgi:hypothetical protein